MDTTNRIKELCDKFSKALQQEAQNLLKSGGIDPSQYNDNYELPKVLVHAAIQNLRHQLQPPNGRARKDAKNLENF